MVAFKCSSRSECHSVAKVSARLLLSFLAISTTSSAAASKSDTWLNLRQQAPFLPYIPKVPAEVPQVHPREHIFTLRNIFHHGTHLYPDLHRRLGVIDEEGAWIVNEDEARNIDHTRGLRVVSSSVDIQRLTDRRIEAIQPLLSAARLSGSPATLSSSAWTLDKVFGPNIMDRETVINMAIMAANSYEPIPSQGEWEDVKHGFNFSESFGWEGDGLRGHIWADESNSTIVLSLKGTSVAVFDGAETTTSDKENDNLFFGCCCGQGGQYLWRQVCDCMTSTFTCNSTCVVKALRQENRYYKAAIELYGNVTELYPTSNVWLTGHSLGGSTSSLLGLTFGLPTVTFEAPGEALAASRLGLPSPPGSNPNAMQTRQNTGIYHIGHTADPIYMGSCNGATSACTLGGYAMETQCHTGKVCVYDTVKDKYWRVSATTHSIRGIIKSILRVYDKVAECIPDDECIDCYNWKYFESNGSEPVTSQTSSSTTSSFATTRTATCQTPGWWGCLDSSTTTATSSSSSTTSSSTTVTCTHYGWFGGCLDPTATATTTTSTTSSSVVVFTSTPSPIVTSTASTTTCLTPGIFYGCKDKPSTTTAHAITIAPST